MTPPNWAGVVKNLASDGAAVIPSPSRIEGARDLYPRLPPQTPSGNFRPMADLSSLFQLAQQAQGRLTEIQTRLAQETITAQAGGGMVTATADGRGQIREIKIDPEAVKSGDLELLEDLVLAAVTQAQQRAAERYQAEVKKLTAGLPLPFQLPL